MNFSIVKKKKKRSKNEEKAMGGGRQIERLDSKLIAFSSSSFSLSLCIDSQFSFAIWLYSIRNNSVFFFLAQLPASLREGDIVND